MKPLIYKFAGKWHCLLRPHRGLGDTPQAAYDGYINKIMKELYNEEEYT